ncbi:MAG: ATP phosphoribosyltransferase regulatory subunit [Alphaproteobacteria bacterium]
MSSHHAALLPPGFADLLPPRAEQEAELTDTLMALYRAHGYERVKPPLIEFEDTLLGDKNSGMGPHTFRLMDPLSGRMLALRADITVQMTRIAATRIADWPRPLRLAYAGQAVRQSSSEHRPERQFGQVGIELLGAAQPEADAEAIGLACRSLDALGVGASTLDLSLPTLIPALCKSLRLDPETEAALRHALDRKDRAAVEKIGGPAADIATQLLRLSGGIEPALDGLQRLSLPDEAQAEYRHLLAVWNIISAMKLSQQITLDLVEHRGFEYQTGLSFTLFADERGIELGRGGRYRSRPVGGSGDGEPATGFTFYSENLLAAVPEPAQKERLYLPYGTDIALAEQYRQKGFVTIAALMPDGDASGAAKTLRCTHILHNNQAVKL